MNARFKSGRSGIQETGRSVREGTKIYVTPRLFQQLQEVALNPRLSEKDMAEEHAKLLGLPEPKGSYEIVVDYELAEPPTL